MKLFKTIDEKFKEIGFEKIKDDEYGVEYHRYIEEYKYTQTLRLSYKESGRHIMQSYDGELFDTRRIGCTSVGLTYYEIKLAMKKMKEKGWKSR